jgi:hypothetical protein
VVAVVVVVEAFVCEVGHQSIDEFLVVVSGQCEVEGLQYGCDEFEFIGLGEDICQ